MATHLRSVAATLLLAALITGSAVSAQKLVVNRGQNSNANESVALTGDGDGLLADDFEVGASGEDWVIDRIRVWAVADPEANSDQGAGDLLPELTLMGGIASDLPSKDDCDCHNLTILKTNQKSARNSTEGADAAISAVANDEGVVRPIEFSNLNWSVPGATRIQFGVRAEGLGERNRKAGYKARYLVFTGTDGQHLRVFSNTGKWQRQFDQGGTKRLRLQAWGHLLAAVSIQLNGESVQVTLQSRKFFDAREVAFGSLHFGPGEATPEDVIVEDADGEDGPKLVMKFPRDAAGLHAADLNACLKGMRKDDTPFEGCDLLRH